jgi:hypothetical protein
VLTGPDPTRHDRPVVPPSRHGPYKNNRAGPGLRQPARGPARPDTTLNRAGLGLAPLVPGPAVPVPGRPGTARWTCIHDADGVIRPLVGGRRGDTSLFYAPSHVP